MQQRIYSPAHALMATGATDEVTQRIQSLTNDAIAKQKAIYDEFHQEIDEVQKTSGQKPRQHEWQEHLMQKKAELQKRSVATIDRCFARVAEYIEVLPPSQWKAATTIFLPASDILTGAAEFVFGKIKLLMRSIGNFLMGNWSTLQDTFDAVKAFFRGLLGGGVFDKKKYWLRLGADICGTK